MPVVVLFAGDHRRHQIFAVTAAGQHNPHDMQGDQYHQPVDQPLVHALDPRHAKKKSSVPIMWPVAPTVVSMHRRATIIAAPAGLWPIWRTSRPARISLT